MSRFHFVQIIANCKGLVELTVKSTQHHSMYGEILTEETLFEDLRNDGTIQW